MAVGTEVAHPVNILDGVSKVPVAVSSKEKERGATVDNIVDDVVAAISSCSLTQAPLATIAEGAPISEETQPVTDNKVSS